jgi:hypothetical protein
MILELRVGRRHYDGGAQDEQPRPASAPPRRNFRHGDRG